MRIVFAALIFVVSDNDESIQREGPGLAADCAAQIHAG